MSATTLSSHFESSSSPEVDHQLTMVIQGHDKTGKSLFGSGSMPSNIGSVFILAPRPVVVISLDGSFEKIRPSLHPSALKDHYFRRWKHYFDPSKEAQVSITEAAEVMGEVDTDVHTAIEGGAATVFLDGGSDAWKLEKIAAGHRPGRLPSSKEDYKQRAREGWNVDPTWDIVRGNFTTRLQAIRDKGIHLIVSEKLKKKYVGREWNGEYTADEFNEMGYLSDVRLGLNRGVNGLFTMTWMGTRYYAADYFMKSYTQNDKLGAEYLAANPEDLKWVGRIPAISFAAVAKMCFPNSKMSEWGVD